MEITISKSQSPNNLRIQLFPFRFFVQRVLLAVLAVLFELKLALNNLAVLARKIGDVLAHGTLKFEKIILRHGSGKSPIANRKSS